MKRWVKDFIYREDETLNWVQRKLAVPVLDKIDDGFVWWEMTVEQGVREIKWAYQRVKYGHDDLAYWNLNSWFIKNSIPIIDKMIENGYGYPVTFDSQSDWHDVLKKMRSGFQHYYDVEMGDGKDRNIHLEMKNDDIDTYETATRFEMTPEEEAEFQEALQLFVKYFYGLWD